MHGVAEVNEDVRQIYIYKNHADKFWAYVSYVNGNCDVGSVDACWKDAAEAVGLDAAAIENGAEANAEKYMAAEFALGDQLGVTGSPTIFVNGAPYDGGRSAEDFKSAVCAAFTTEPSECEQVLGGDASAASGSCE
jgi:protein-disulfide isomerase